MGRSRGGPITEIHLVCDGRGRSLSVVLTGGNVNDRTVFTWGMAGSAFGRPGRAGPVADQGLLDHDHPRPPARNAASPRPSRNAAPWSNAASQRCFNRLKQFRATATRLDQSAMSYRDMIDLATLLSWR